MDGELNIHGAIGKVAKVLVLVVAVVAILGSVGCYDTLGGLAGLYGYGFPDSSLYDPTDIIQDVIGYRQSVMEQSANAWDEYIRQ